mgnify:CR=1 FL=1
MELDNDFIKRATRVTAFNLTSNDFTSVRHKREIQHLYSAHMFGSFDPNKAVGKMDKRKYNALVKQLKKDSASQYDKLHNLPLKGVGPGEAVLYLLTEKGHLGGGSSAGIDLVNGSEKFEVKAVRWKSKATKDYVSDFKLGGNIPGMSQLEVDIQTACYEAGITSSKGAPEISGSKFAELKKSSPGVYESLSNRYKELAYKHYFRGHNVIFILNDSKDPQYGEIIAIKEVKRDDIEMERFTSKSIKPLIRV